MPSGTGSTRGTTAGWKKIKWTVSPDREQEQKRNRATVAVNYKETL
jgi:hypothetical protein